MVGIPLAEQLAKQEAERAAAAGQGAPPGAAAPAQPAGAPERRPSTRTMIGVPLAEQLAAQERAAAPAGPTAPQPAPAAPSLAPGKAAGTISAGSFAEEDDRTSMMKAFSEEELFGEAPEPEPEPAAAPAPAAPSLSLSEPEPAGEELEPTTAVAPLDEEPEPAPAAAPRAATAASGGRPLPSLPAWPHEPEAVQPPPTPAGLFGSIGYGFKTLGLSGRITKCLATAEKRRAALAQSREEALISAGQQAWQENLPTASLSAHRAAIEQAQAASADLSEQIAGIDRAFAEEEAQAKAGLDASTQEVEGLERQHAERDREYQAVARETNDANKILKDTEKQIASLEKTIEKLNATPQDKRAPDHGQKVAETERELGTLREQVPGVKARVDELAAERDRQKDGVTALRNEIKQQRAQIAEAEKALAARAKEVEAQKASLRGEIAGAAAHMRGPLLAAGGELHARRGAAPSLAPWFASVDEHDAALVDEAQRESQYRAAKQAYQSGVARKGLLLVGGGLLLLVVLVLVLALVLGGRGGGGSLASGPRNALPKDLGGVVNVDVKGLLASPLAKRLGDKVAPQLGALGMGEAGEILAALDAKPEDLRSVTVGLRFPAGGGDPLTLGVIDARVDAEKVKEVFKKEGFEEHTTDGGALKLVKRDKILVLTDGLFLVAEGDASALLDESPLLAKDRASVGDNETLMALSKEIDPGATAWGVFVVPAGLDRAMRKAPVKLAAGDRVGVSVDISDGIVVRGHFVLGEAARAEQLEAFLKAGLEQAKAQVGDVAKEFPPAAALIDDVKGVLDDIAVRRSAEAVSVRIEVPQALIDRALDLVEPMMGMLLQGGL
jgi:predicted  nucleic acid-binding Zn-ribbon protein